MPIKKNRLNRSEQVEHRAAVEQLQAWGLISKTPDRLDGSSALDIRVDHMASKISETRCGTPYYAIWVELVAKQANLILVHCQVTTSWDDQIILGSDEVKSLIGPRGLVYAREGTLNERIENGLRFHSCGDLVRGTIFAWGVRPIPAAYSTGSIVPFQLTFTDSLGNSLVGHGAGHVTRRRKSAEGMRIKKDLFDGVLDNTAGERDRHADDEKFAKERSRRN
jgi:hypothetical protein